MTKIKVQDAARQLERGRARSSMDRISGTAQGQPQDTLGALRKLEEQLVRQGRAQAREERRAAVRAEQERLFQPAGAGPHRRGQALRMSALRAAVLGGTRRAEKQPPLRRISENTQRGRPRPKPAKAERSQGRGSQGRGSQGSQAAQPSAPARSSRLRPQQGNRPQGRPPSSAPGRFHAPALCSQPQRSLCAGQPAEPQRRAPPAGPRSRASAVLTSRRARSAG